MIEWIEYLPFLQQYCTAFLPCKLHVTSTLEKRITLLIVDCAAEQVPLFSGAGICKVLD